MFSAFPRRRLLPTQPGRCVRVLFSPPRHLRTGPSSRRGYHRRPLESSSWGRAASLWRPPTSSATPPDFGGRQVLCPKSWCPAVANRARRFAGQVRRLRARYGVCGPGTAFVGQVRRLRVAPVGPAGGDPWSLFLLGGVWRRSKVCRSKRSGREPNTIFRAAHGWTFCHFPPLVMGRPSGGRGIVRPAR